ncbi:hypothetical protein [Chryseobacterium sp. 22543]|uniref:hypothetical protein n=1 Tax=Chryseobacterium sp. 22543 TaxID=3453940 RepID=UPI003F82D5FE
MLYQLHTTIDGTEFIALLSTELTDLKEQLPEILDQRLTMYYGRLAAQIGAHSLHGLAAEINYPWPSLSIGFEKFEALNLFSKWQNQSWMAMSEDDKTLINSPRDRKSGYAGRNIFLGLELVRRYQTYPLLMVKIQPENSVWESN